MGKEMREPTFLVLSSLAEGRKHGHAILMDAAKLSGDSARLRVGTLYSALERLTDEGLVEAAGEETVGGRLRRYFEITESGAAALSEESARLAHQAAQAQARLAARVVAEGGFAS